MERPVAPGAVGAAEVLSSVHCGGEHADDDDERELRNGHRRPRGLSFVTNAGCWADLPYERVRVIVANSANLRLRRRCNTCTADSRYERRSVS